jgi:hypothetical protein
MHDERTLTPAEEDARDDSAVLALLVEDDTQRPWSLEELAREIRNEIRAIDSVNRLYGAGLIHRLEGFVWPTRAAVKAEALRR